MARNRNWISAILVMLLVVMASACGNDDAETTDPPPAPDDASTDEQDADEQDMVEATVTLGSLQIANAAPQIVDPEIFTDHGLTLDVQYAASGAAIVPGVVGGSYDIGYGSLVAVVQAAEQDLPVQMIASGDVSVGEIVVLADSGIEDATDLEGRTLATNALRSTVDLEVSTRMEEQGADPTTVNFIEVPFPGQLAALDDGTIDAAVLPEPFLSQARADDSYAVLFSIFDSEPTNVYFASTSFLEQNPEVARQFVDAIRESNARATDDADAARAAVSEVTGAPAEAIAIIALPTWVSDPVDPGDIEVVVERMVKFGLISEAPPVDTIVWTEAT